MWLMPKWVMQLGWKTWQQLGSRGFDFNISFESTAARKLAEMLPLEEQTTLKVSLRWLTFPLLLGCRLSGLTAWSDAILCPCLL